MSQYIKTSEFKEGVLSLYNDCRLKKCSNLWLFDFWFPKIFLRTTYFLFFSIGTNTRPSVHRWWCNQNRHLSGSTGWVINAEWKPGRHRWMEVPKAFFGFFLNCRWLLALSSHCFSHAEWEASSSGCPTRSVLPRRLCRNLPLSGNFTSSSTNSLCKHFIWTEFLIIALCCSSGSLANG